MIIQQLHPQNALSKTCKLLLCMLSASLVSLALFVFMQRLINQPIPNLATTEFSGFVELFKVAPEAPVEDITPEPVQEISEPETPQQSLNLLNQADSAISLPDTFEFSSEGLFPGLAVGGEGSNIQVAKELLGDFGEDTQQGFIEITPFATRRPNIPDVAYENQLNGWVLVIFNVSPLGKTRNIKILDASPKGIFEEEVIRAVQHWHYNVKDIIRDGQDVVMTQKVILNWQNYQQNMPYND